MIALMGLSDSRYWSEDDCDFRRPGREPVWPGPPTHARELDGFSGVEQEDAIIAMSMGPLFDRSKEHLVPATGRWCA